MSHGVAYYDRARNPPTFNALDFLLLAERWRRAHELDRIEVKVLPGPREGFRQDSLPPYGGAERMRWLQNIVLPLPVLLPSCGDRAQLVDREHRPGDGVPEFGRDQYTVGPSIWTQAFATGEYVLRVPETMVAQRPARYVTISLRNTGWWVERTSDFAQWAIVAAELRRNGYDVVVIPDGVKPDETIPGVESDAHAACDVLARASLYAGAELNLGIANGPLWLCWFLGLPVLICKIINENEPCAGAGMWRAMGVEPGTQPRKAKPRQRLVWQSDQAEIVLKHAFELLTQDVDHVAPSDARAA